MSGQCAGAGVKWRPLERSRRCWHQPQPLPLGSGGGRGGEEEEAPRALAQPQTRGLPGSSARVIASPRPPGCPRARPAVPPSRRLAPSPRAPPRPALCVLCGAAARRPVPPAPGWSVRRRGRAAFAHAARGREGKRRDESRGGTARSARPPPVHLRGRRAENGGAARRAGRGLGERPFPRRAGGTKGTAAAGGGESRPAARGRRRQSHADKGRGERRFVWLPASPEPGGAPLPLQPHLAFPLCRREARHLLPRWAPGADPRPRDSRSSPGVPLGPCGSAGVQRTRAALGEAVTAAGTWAVGSSPEIPGETRAWPRSSPPSISSLFKFLVLTPVEIESSALGALSDAGPVVGILLAHSGSPVPNASHLHISHQKLGNRPNELCQGCISR